MCSIKLWKRVNHSPNFVFYHLSVRNDWHHILWLMKTHPGWGNTCIEATQKGGGVGLKLAHLLSPTCTHTLKGPDPTASVPMYIAKGWRQRCKDVPITLGGGSPGPNSTNTSPHGQMRKQMTCWWKIPSWKGTWTKSRASQLMLLGFGLGTDISF